MLASTDTIADMLTRIRNALKVKHADVLVPASKEKTEIAKILLEEGYINGFEVKSNGKYNEIVISLKYDEQGQSVIQGLKRISKPGLRVYAQADKIPYVISGLGTAIISTNKGIITDRAARSLNVGGEVLAFVW